MHQNNDQTPRAIELNCDMGELADYRIRDRQLMGFIDRCNIACGGHAGDSLSMSFLIQQAKLHKVKIGAHPSYPDRQHFGRRSIAIELPDLATSISSQLNSLQRWGEQFNTPIDHIKFHGALYNDMEQNQVLTELMLETVKRVVPTAKIVCLANGAVSRYCQLQGLDYLNEGFVDRRYLDNGQLQGRSHVGSVLHQTSEVLLQAKSMITDQRVVTASGNILSIAIDTLCLHGDHPQGISVAKGIRQLLDFNDTEHSVGMDN